MCGHGERLAHPYALLASKYRRGALGSGALPVPNLAQGEAAGAHLPRGVCGSRDGPGRQGEAAGGRAEAGGRHGARSPQSAWLGLDASAGGAALTGLVLGQKSPWRRQKSPWKVQNSFRRGVKFVLEEAKSLLNGEKFPLEGAKFLLNDAKSVLKGAKVLEGEKSLLEGAKFLLEEAMFPLEGAKFFLEGAKSLLKGENLLLERANSSWKGQNPF